MVYQKFVKYNGRSYKVKKNNTFWTKFTPEDRMKQLGVKTYSTVSFLGKERRVYEHRDPTVVGQHIFKGKILGLSARESKKYTGKQYATNYTYLDAARDFEKVLGSDGNLVEISRIWSGSYFFSEYTAEDHYRTMDEIV